MPDEVTLVAERPPGFEHLTHEAWAAEIRRAVHNEEDKARGERAAKKLRVLGRKAVLRALPTDRPATVEPRRGLRPHLACRNEQRRVAEIARLQLFRVEHSAARLRFVAGERSVVFPAGTYAFARLGVRCAPPPPS